MNFVLEIKDGGDKDISILPKGFINIASANWNVPITVTVSAKDDEDGLRGEAVITHWDYDKYLGKEDASGDGIKIPLTVREIDDDSGIVIGGDEHTEGEDPNVTVAEGGSAAWTVALATEPAGDVTVSVARKDGGDTDLTVAPARASSSPPMTSTRRRR